MGHHGFKPGFRVAGVVIHEEALQAGEVLRLLRARECGWAAASGARDG